MGKRIGRPAISDKGAERHTVTLTPENWRYIEAFGDNRSLALRRLVACAMAEKIREKYGVGTT